MANENAVFLAPHVDAVGNDCDVADGDLVAEMMSLRSDMVKFAQSLQRVANPSTDRLGHDLLFRAAKSLGREDPAAQARIADATAFELAAQITNLLNARASIGASPSDDPISCNLGL